MLTGIDGDVPNAPVDDDACTRTACEPVVTAGTQIRALMRAVFCALNLESPSTKTFHDLGQLSCPAGFGATPFSMGVDRNTIAATQLSGGEDVKQRSRMRGRRGDAARTRRARVSGQHVRRRCAGAGRRLVGKRMRARIRKLPLRLLIKSLMHGLVSDRAPVIRLSLRPAAIARSWPFR